MNAHAGRLLAAGLLALLCATSLACDASQQCSSCAGTELVVEAAANAKKIDAFLSKKGCETWTGLVFKTVALSFEGAVSCRTGGGIPYPGDGNASCEVVEELSLTINQEISEEATTAVVDEMAKDGQFECEPNGTMVFNRGRARFSELDSLFEPVFFTPSGFSEVGTVVGFEVVLENELVQKSAAGSPYWCHNVKTASLIFVDIQDADGKSVLSSFL